MTPCQKLGYKVGDKFTALEGSLFPVGTIITLVKDDGTDLPLFAGEGSGYENVTGEHGMYEAGAYEYLTCVELTKGE